MRFSVLALVIATSLVSVSALAAPAGGPGGRGRGDSAAQDQKFPMKAAEFQQHVDAHTKKAREHMEKRLVKHNATDAEKKDARARFDAGVVEIQRVVSQATADGVVTKDEADKVRAKAKEVRHANRVARHAKK